MGVHVFLTGRYLVSGYHGHRAGQRRAPALGAPPYEGAIPDPKEQPAHPGGQLQQAAEGVCGGLPQQGAPICEYNPNPKLGHAIARKPQASWGFQS